MKPEERIGLLGGTFDPIHDAHLAVAKAAARSAGLEKVLMMPSGHPPLKDPTKVSLPIYRYAMTELAVRSDPLLEISDLEIKRVGPSYTVDTLKELNAGLGSPRDIYLICGTDVLFDLPDWYDPLGVLQNCTLLVGTRPGFVPDEVAGQMAFLRKTYGADIQTFEMPQLDISSTEIRQRLKADPLAAAPVPSAVRAFLRRHRPYQNQSCLRELSEHAYLFLIRAHQELWNKMTHKRLLHSVGTAITAVQLALRFGADAEKAAFAGILHDCAKELSWRDYLAAHPEERDWLEGFPQVVHGPYGAEIVRRYYDISDPEILDAITYHTTLRKNPSQMEKIIFLSDKIEPGRTFSDLHPIRRLALTDLNKATLACLSAVAISLAKRNARQHPYSAEALRSLAHAPAVPAIRKDM